MPTKTSQMKRMFRRMRRLNKRAVTLDIARQTSARKARKATALRAQQKASRIANR